MKSLPRHHPASAGYPACEQPPGSTAAARMRLCRHSPGPLTRRFGGWGEKQG